MPSKISSESRILVVDDVEAICTYTSMILSRLGYKHVDASHDFETAKDKITNEHLDLVILDLNLPDGNGLDLLDLLQYHQIHCKVLICSSQSQDHNMSTALENGAVGFMVKPVTETGLTSALDRL
ncbi:response regulator [Alteromonadaceae bacterium M269]|nr:response regulator [Alteromonadaceae bacterium M269]